MVKCFQKYHLTLLQLTTIEKVHFIITRKASFENVRQDLSATLIEDKVEYEFPKILVPRLSQHTSDVNIECAGKSE